MGFFRRFLKGNGSEQIPELLDSLNNQDVAVRLQAVSSISQIGDHSALGPLMVATRDDSEDVRQAALSSLARMKLGEADLERVTVRYLLDTQWTTGLTDWCNDRASRTALMNASVQHSGLNWMSTYGGIGHDIVGFIFDKQYNALRAAIEAGRKTTVLVWAGRSMVWCEFGFDMRATTSTAKIMKNWDTIEFIAGNCDPTIERQLLAIIGREPIARWGT